MKKKEQKRYIEFPVNWKPYPFQKDVWSYLIKGGKTALCIWHRRSGKDIVALNWVILCCLKDPGVYWYVLPTQNQAKMTIWDGVTLEGRSYLSFVPKAAIKSITKADLTITFVNGSILKFVGASRPDNLRGSGIKGAVVSEYAVMNEDMISSVVMPMIVRSKGWIVYLYTPSPDSKQTHGFDLYERLKSEKNIFTQILTIEDTADSNGGRLVSNDDLMSMGIGEAQKAREFYCAFDAWKFTRKKEGGFTHALALAENEGRIYNFNYRADKLVNTYWDVGIVDYTVIWFIQELQDHISVIDVIIDKGRDFKYYLGEMKNCPYKYGKNVLPHDMARRGQPTLDTRLQTANDIAASLGFKPFSLGRRYLREEMFAKGREIINICHFNKNKCQNALELLMKFEPSKRINNNVASTIETDVADSFCYMAMDAKTIKQKEREHYFTKDKKHFEVIDDYNPISN